MKQDECVERVAGIEPAYSAWKAAALPLCYTRMDMAILHVYSGHLNSDRPCAGDIHA